MKTVLPFHTSGNFHDTCTCLKAFTGDTLFIGSCGRPDLVGSVGFTSEQMSKMMFKTLKEKICTLPDDVMVGDVRL